MAQRCQPSIYSRQLGFVRVLGALISSNSSYRGIIILIAIAICSPISAIFTGIGSAVGVLVAYLFGAPPAEIASGLWGYDAALASCAIGGMFYVLVCIPYHKIF